MHSMHVDAARAQAHSLHPTFPHPASPTTSLHPPYFGHSAKRRCPSCSQRASTSTACCSCHVLRRAPGPEQPGANPSGEEVARASRSVSLR